jgi:hypothetical protein
MDESKIFRHKALPPPPQMKPPTNPSRFRAPIRHYHRHHSSPGASWDSWVGAEEKKKSRFVLPLLSILVLLVVSALLVIGYAMI